MPSQFQMTATTPGGNDPYASVLARSVLAILALNRIWQDIGKVLVIRTSG
jgi:hypothetical protein